MIILICIFARKLASMKQNIFYTILFFVIVLIASCGVYNEPCEGVVQVNISKPNS